MSEFLPEPDILLDPTPTPEIPLPKGWTSLVVQAVLQAIALARIVILNAANWPSDKECDGLRLRVENDRLRAEVIMLKQELVLKQGAKMEIPPDLIAPRIVTSKYPNHLWGADITLVPTAQGFALGVEPEAIPQEHPYSFHVLNVIDHFSRRLMGEKIFPKCPTGSDIVGAFEEICCENGATPKHLVLDQGVQFYCHETRDWCQRRSIKPRFGAVGKHGSIAVVERLHLSMKSECTQRIIVPVSKKNFEKELSLWRHWYNSCRPHMTLKGRTLDEVYHNLRAASTLPRIEPRPKVRHSTPCAKPRVMMAGKAGRHVDLRLLFLEGRSHLPVLTIQRE